MICNEFKGGIGYVFRQAQHVMGGLQTVGVLVQCNYGQRDQLRIAGVPVGRELGDAKGAGDDDVGSIIVVVATDAPSIQPNSSGWRSECHSAWEEMEAIRVTARATSLSRFRPPIQGPTPPKTQSKSRYFPTDESIQSSWQPFRQRKKQLSTRWWQRSDYRRRWTHRKGVTAQSGA